MARKQYQLDYNIERDVDRMVAIKDILANLTKPLSSGDLEQLASYVLYGKDENGLNAVKRGETTDSNKRYNSWKRKADKNQSLDSILENPFADPNSLHQLDEKRPYPIPVQKIDKVADADIPGMRDLWEAIARTEHTVNVGLGKIPPNPEDQLITDPYRLYQLRHQLIDMKRHQFYLKDAYKPQIRFQNIRQPERQLMHYDDDSYYWITRAQLESKLASNLNPYVSHNIEDYEYDAAQDKYKWIVRHQKIDYTNPAHIKAIMDNYSDLYMMVWDKPDSPTRALLFDFDRYADMARLDELRQYLLTRRIDKATIATILQELQEKWGLVYNESHLYSIIAKEIPARIAMAAKRHELMLTTPQKDLKQCYRCKQWLPRHPLFFAYHHGRKDGLASNCKECEKKRRQELKNKKEGAPDERFKHIENPNVH